MEHLAGCISQPSNRRQLNPRSLGPPGRAMVLLLKNLLFTAVAPGTVAVLVPWLIAGSRPQVSGLAFAISVALFGLGVAIYAWCVWDFASFGRGTPAPIDAPRHLVIRGLYRFVRNPMYLGVLTLILAWALLLQARVLLVYAALVGTLFHLFIVFYEEPHLEREFGDEYREYKATVSRWVPSPPSRPAA